jgi:hypothetical protein
MVDVGFSIWQLLIVAVIVLLLFWRPWRRRKREDAKPQRLATPAVAKPVESKPVEPKAVTARETQEARSAQRGAIFICYRREDSAESVGRIYDRLVAHFGQASVFKDVDSIPLGADFRKHIDKFIGECQVVLVVIGPQWLRGSDREAKTRLHDPGDYVRLEIEAALSRDIPVIPLLVGGARMPEESDLATSLGQLAYRQGVPTRPDPDFNNDIGRVIAGIESQLGDGAG